MDAADPAMNDDGLPELHSLVREAFAQQDKFDKFDPRSPEDQIILKRICQDWDVANIALIQHVLRDGPAMLDEIDRRIPR